MSYLDYPNAEYGSGRRLTQRHCSVLSEMAMEEAFYGKALTHGPAVPPLTVLTILLR